MSGVLGTLGKGPAFRVLMGMLLEWEEKDPDQHIRRKVTKHLHNFPARVISLRSVENPRHREDFLIALRNRFLEDTDQAGWPEKVRTHTRTCLTTIYRREIQQVHADAKVWREVRKERSRQANAARLAAMGGSVSIPVE